MALKEKKKIDEKSKELLEEMDKVLEEEEKSEKKKEKSDKNKKSDKKENKEKKAAVKKESWWHGVKSEFKKVRWPNKKEMLKYSIATIAFILFFAVFFYLIELIVWLVETMQR